MYVNPTTTPKLADVRIDLVGSRLVGVDVFSDGSESCLRSNLGEFKTPERALAYKMLFERPDFLILASEGKITEETLDKMEAAIVKLKEAKSGGQAR